MPAGNNAPATPVSIQVIKQFFYTARQHGYLDDQTPRLTSPYKPGFKYTVYEDGQFKMVDEWCANPMPYRSSGQTTIWYQGTPVWEMHYWGRYPKEAIPFLKHALRTSYQDDEFYGGRGRSRFVDREFSDDLIYTNFVKHNDFEIFEGTEEVLRQSGPHVGYHNYHGHLLI